VLRRLLETRCQRVKARKRTLSQKAFEKIRLMERKNLDSGYRPANEREGWRHREEGGRGYKRSESHPKSLEAVKLPLKVLCYSVVGLK